jgi:DNA-binding MarR family transcriptional regulator
MSRCEIEILHVTPNDSGISAKEISEMLGRDLSTVHKTVKVLVGKGLFQMSKGQGNREYRILPTGENAYLQGAVV